MTPPLRYRCTSCGNLTRFDVTASQRTRAFHHYTVGGELSVEHEDVLEETIEHVGCRWCGPAGAVQVFTDEGSAGSASAADGQGRSSAS